MIDIHCHILPGIDDGSSNLEETKALLEKQKQQGVDLVVATPHFYADDDTPEAFLARRQNALNMTMPIARNLGMQIRTGAEVHYFPSISGMDLEPFLIEGTNLLLLEMPFGKWTSGMIEEVLALQDRCQVVLAHIERYWHWQSLLNGVWNKFANAGILFQVNTTSLINKDTARKVLKLIKKGNIAFMASDAHNTRARPPRFEEAFAVMESKLGRQSIRELTDMSMEIFEDYQV